MNLGLFSCLFMMKRNNQYYENIDDLSGLSKNHPLISLSLLIILFSLAGIPPMAGFFAKFYVFSAVIKESMYFLAITGLLSTIISAFYYLRIIKIIYFDPEKEKYDFRCIYISLNDGHIFFRLCSSLGSNVLLGSNSNN